MPELRKEIREMFERRNKKAAAARAAGYSITYGLVIEDRGPAEPVRIVCKLDDFEVSE